MSKPMPYYMVSADKKNGVKQTFIPFDSVVYIEEANVWMSTEEMWTVHLVFNTSITLNADEAAAFLNMYVYWLLGETSS